MDDFYSKRYLDYYNRTVSVDSALFLSEFSNRLKPGAKVLDIGCGSGRDLLWMKKNSFKPLGLERSEGLAELAKNHSGCDVIIEDYEKYDFSAIKVDGMLFSASLVHVPHNRIQTILSNALNAFKQDGFSVDTKLPLDDFHFSKTDERAVINGLFILDRDDESV